MPMTAHQRRDLLRIEQGRDAAAITDAIKAVLADNPDTDLREIEQWHFAPPPRRAVP